MNSWHFHWGNDGVAFKVLLLRCVASTYHRYLLFARTNEYSLLQIVCQSDPPHTVGLNHALELFAFERFLIPHYYPHSSLFAPRSSFLFPRPVCSLHVHSVSSSPGVTTRRAMNPVPLCSPVPSRGKLTHWGACSPRKITTICGGFLFVPAKESHGERQN